MSDLMMLQRLAEPALPPGCRAEAPENRRSGSFWGPQSDRQERSSAPTTKDPLLLPIQPEFFKPGAKLVEVPNANAALVVREHTQGLPIVAEANRKDRTSRG